MPYVSNAGVNIHYAVEGVGPPLVLLHGFTSSSESWRHYGYVKALRSNYRLIMPDARGHGASDKPHERPAYAWDVRVSDIEAVMDDLDVESAHIWGYSMGGVYAFGLVRRAPARVRTTIIGGAHPYAASWSAFHRVDGTDPQLFLAALESFVGVLPPEVRARVLNNDFQALAAAAGDRESMEDVFASITMPCLLYVGEEDSRYALVKAAATSIASSDFAVLAGCDHVQTDMRSDLVLPHVNEFLSSVAARSSVK